MWIFRALYRWLVPQVIKDSIRTYRILSFGFGHLRSLRTGSCVDHYGKPLPWYSYPAIEYLEQLDLSDKAVFEFGSGNSTLFWASRCKMLVSVEDNPEWYSKVKPKLSVDIEYLLVNGAEDYVATIKRYPEKFDVIVIDGNYRLECAQAALTCLKDDGFIILDNSDWYERSAAVLLKANMIHVSMSGFGPMLPYTWATSFYFTRNVQLKPRFERHPQYAVGALRIVEADPRGERDRV